MNSADPRRVHASVIKKGKTDRSILNNLITLYSKSNFLSEALRIFNRIPSPNVVSWTSLISANSNSSQALTHFVSMLRRSTLPNQRTLATLFKTCASISSLSFGLQLHSFSIKLSLSVKPITGSSLVHFYSKAKLPGSARKVFDEITLKNEVCYSSVIVGLAQNCRPTEALRYFADLRASGFGSTKMSVSAALRAAAELPALKQCRMIHAHSVVAGLDEDVVVGTALVGGYGKCGIVEEARRVFDELMPVLNVIGWNAMLSGYSRQGDKDSAVELFRLMESSRGLVPDENTFLAIMKAFCIAGLADETERWLRKMETEYGLVPWLEHYTCLVGAMGRVGRLEDAKRIALTMPCKPDAAVWKVLLSNAAHHGAVDMAKEMRDKLLELDPHDDSAYVIAANVFSSARKLEEMQELRKYLSSLVVEARDPQDDSAYVIPVNVISSARKLEEVQELRKFLSSLVLEARDPQDDSAYVIPANVFSSARKLEEVQEV